MTAVLGSFTIFQNKIKEPSSISRLLTVDSIKENKIYLNTEYYILKDIFPLNLNYVHQE